MMIQTTEGGYSMSNHPSLTKNLRATPRGVLVIRLFLACVALAVFAMLLATVWFQQPIAPAIAADEQSSGVYQMIVVQPGDTLWEISSRLAQNNDRAAVLEQIMTYNDLETSDLKIGQRLFVPVEQD